MVRRLIRLHDARSDMSDDSVLHVRDEAYLQLQRPAWRAWQRPAAQMALKRGSYRRGRLQWSALGTDSLTTPR